MGEEKVATGEMSEDELDCHRNGRHAEKLERLGKKAVL